MAVTGSLQVKNGTYYAVLNLKDENGKRKQKWISTGLPIKGNKRRAEKILRGKIQEWDNKIVEYYSSITVAEYFEKWLVEIKSEVRPIHTETTRVIWKITLFLILKRRVFCCRT
ncbi:MAG: hypothetical protein ACI4RP_02635 [Acutalibacteraceae bacterium]